LRAAVQFLGQGAALDELQGEERQPQVLADLVDRNDVGMSQPGHQLRLAAEPRPCLGTSAGRGPDHLQGHRAFQGHLPGPVNDAHTALAKHGQQFVAGDRRKVRRRHRGAAVGPRLGRLTRGQQTVLDGLFHLELNGELLRQVRKAGLVFAQLGRLAAFLAPQHLVEDQLEHRLGIVAQLRLCQVGLDQDALAAPPAQLLIRQYRQQDQVVAVVRQRVERRGGHEKPLSPARASS
jgi:hypothetical protein